MEGTEARRTTEFRSVAISLAARVNSKTKAKIWVQEYIDLGSLLSIAPSTNSYSLSLKLTNDNSSATSKLCLEPNDKSLCIFNINQWLTAFNIFVSVYTKQFNQAAPKLMKYCKTVRTFQQKVVTGDIMTSSSVFQGNLTQTFSRGIIFTGNFGSER